MVYEVYVVGNHGVHVEADNERQAVAIANRYIETHSFGDFLKVADRFELDSYEAVSAYIDEPFVGLTSSVIYPEETNCWRYKDLTPERKRFVKIARYIQSEDEVLVSKIMDIDSVYSDEDMMNHPDYGERLYSEEYFKD